METRGNDERPHVKRIQIPYLLHTRCEIAFSLLHERRPVPLHGTETRGDSRSMTGLCTASIISASLGAVAGRREGDQL